MPSAPPGPHRPGRVVAGVGAEGPRIGRGVHQDRPARGRRPDRREHAGQQPACGGGPRLVKQGRRVTGQRGAAVGGGADLGREMGWIRAG